MSFATEEPAVTGRHPIGNIATDSIVVDGMNGSGRTSGPEFEEFCEDVRQHGILSAILVRASQPGDEQAWHLIAGHRRLAAAKHVGLSEIAVVVSTLGPEYDEELRLVENLHRRDLQPLEEAEGYTALLANGGVMEVARVAQRIGRSPRYVYDRLRLMNLVEDAKRLLREGRIELGHAIVLARLEQNDQQRALDPEERGGLFERENTLFDDDDRLAQQQSKDPWAGFKTRTAAELQGWVDQHVRARADAIDPMLFPVTAEELGAAKKVIPITRSYHLQDSAKSKERTYGPQSWKRADGEKNSKACTLQATGFVVAGPGRNESFAICVAKDKCTIHWAAEQKEKAKRAKERVARKPSTANDPKASRAASDEYSRAKELAIQKAQLEADRRIGLEADRIASSAKPEDFIRALALEACSYGNFSWALKQLEIEVRKDRLERWVQEQPINQVQRALTVMQADFSNSFEQFAKALGVDVKAIEDECKQAALDELKNKTKDEPAKIAAAKPKKTAAKKSAKAKRGAR